MTGEALGTPSYMPPEQAAGDRERIGPASDVYALGAVLYCLLTGRPPFQSAVPMETMRQVLEQEPVPPRRLNAGVPVDLETMCLKCLEKEPGRRYPTAQALVEELGRFERGEPVQARPVGRLERGWRWCRRNPLIAVMTASIFLLLVSAVVISSVAAVTIAQERQAAEVARDVANEERQAAEEARDIANEQVTLALDTVRTLIYKVQDQLQNAPRTQPLKKALLETATKGLEQIAKRAQGNNSTEVAFAFAGVHNQMGQVYRELGETEKAFQHVQESHRINLEQARAQPDSDRAQRNLASSYTALAGMSKDMRGDLKASLEFYQQALHLREQLYAHPHGRGDGPTPKEIKVALAETHIRVGNILLRMGDPAPAREYFRRSLLLREELVQAYPQDVDLLQSLANSYHALGEACFSLRETEQGRQYFGECLKIRERLFQGEAENPSLKLQLARWCGVLGDKATLAQDFPDARKHYQRSLELYRELVELDPKNVNYQRGLGTTYYQIATASHLANDDATADHYFRECRRIRQTLADASPQNSGRLMELMGVLPHCGEHAKAAELAAKLRQSQPKDRLMLIAVACCYSTCAEVPKDPALRQEYIKKALEALNEAVALGFKDLAFFETDPDLAAIRNEPAFRQLLEKLQSR